MNDNLTPEVLLSRWRRVLIMNPKTKYADQIKKVIENLEAIVEE